MEQFLIPAASDMLANHHSAHWRSGPENANRTASSAKSRHNTQTRHATLHDCAQVPLPSQTLGQADAQFQKSSVLFYNDKLSRVPKCDFFMLRKALPHLQMFICLSDLMFCIKMSHLKKHNTTLLFLSLSLPSKTAKWSWNYYTYTLHHAQIVDIHLLHWFKTDGHYQYKRSICTVVNSFLVFLFGKISTKKSYEWFPWD